MAICANSPWTSETNSSWRIAVGAAVPLAASLGFPLHWYCSRSAIAGAFERSSLPIGIWTLDKDTTDQSLISPNRWMYGLHLPNFQRMGYKWTWKFCWRDYPHLVGFKDFSQVYGQERRKGRSANCSKFILFVVRFYDTRPNLWQLYWSCCDSWHTLMTGALQKIMLGRLVRGE